MAGFCPTQAATARRGCTCRNRYLARAPADAPLWPPDVRRGGSDQPVTEATVSCRNVWKVYGPHADRIVGSPDASLLPAGAVGEDGLRGGRSRRLVRRHRGRGLRGHGALRFRQVHARADDQPTARSDRRTGPDRRRGRRAARRRAPPRHPPPEDQHGLPALRPVPAPAHRGERRVRPGGAGDREGRA